MSVNPGAIVEAQPPEPEAVCRNEVRIDASPEALAGKMISYGRLGGSFLQVMDDWNRWQGKIVVPVPLGKPIRGGASDFAAVLLVNAKRLLKTTSWWTVLLAVGWQVGCRFGDLGTGAWLHSLTGGRL